MSAFLGLHFLTNFDLELREDQQVVNRCVRAVFPKVRSAEHFWSARTIYLVRENRNNTHLKPINH